MYGASAQRITDHRADYFTNDAQPQAVIKAPLTITIDGKVLHELITSYTLKRAARGPSTLTGGELTTRD